MGDRLLFGDFNNTMGKSSSEIHSQARVSFVSFDEFGGRGLVENLGKKRETVQTVRFSTAEKTLLPQI